MKKAYVFLIVALFFSCDLYEPDYDQQIAAAKAEKIVTLSQNGRTVVAEVQYILPSTAYSFHSEDHSYDGKTFTSKLYITGKRRQGLQMLSSFNHKFKIKLKPGENKLRFWRAEKRYLETTVVIE